MPSRTPADGAGPRATPRPMDPDPLTRLSRLLEAARAASRAEVLAVADQTGCLVAGAGAWADCEELAAVAPLIGPRVGARSAANDTLPDRFDVMARRREIRRLSVDGLEVLLCGEGDVDARRLALDGAAESCRVAFARGTRPA